MYLEEHAIQSTVRAVDQVLDRVLELAREKGATLLLVTHSSEATAWADRVLHMSDGRLEAASEPI